MDRVAYLNSEYPAVSHTFVEREVQCVRAAGIEVRTFSIRRPGRHATLGAAHEAAARETEYVIDGVGAVVLAQVAALVTNPLGTLRAHRRAQQLAPTGIRARLLHAFYAMEAARLAGLLARHQLRHVHVHMANAAAMVALLATVFDRRLSYSLTVHGSAEFFDVHRLRLGAKAGGATFVRCISRFCRAQVMTWSPPAAWEDFHIVHTGVDTTRFQPPAARPQDRLRILTIGRMVPIKGYAVLLEACRRLTDEGVAWSLEMIGDGPRLPALRALAVKLGIDARITFRGALAPEDVVGRFDDANVMVVSSFMEGVPVVLMEAMAAGLAVVATNVGGISELIESERDGLLVAASSPETIAAALRRLADDQALRERLGAAGRETVVAAWDVEQAGREVAELLRATSDGARA